MILYLDTSALVKKYVEEKHFDAIHLASALTIGSAVTDDFLFGCYDERLNQAARAEGLGTFPVR